MKTVFLAGIFHESHSFLQGSTPGAEFTTYIGTEVVEKNRNSGSPAGAVVAFAEQSGWHVIPSVHSFATPGPKVEESHIQQVFHIILKDLATWVDEIDGVYLVLHGAMVGTHCDDVEGALLEEIKGVLGPRSVSVPVCGVLDLHCNFTPKMARFSSALVAYRKNPHTDASNAATRAAEILDHLMDTHEQAVTAYRHGNIILPPVATATGADPMAILLHTAAAIQESERSILIANVFAGFAYADTPHTGLSFSVVTTGIAAEIDHHLESLVDTAHHHRIPLESDEHNPDTLLASLTPSERGPVLLIEASDNIGGGTPGDGTGLLRKLLEYEIKGFAVVINDPECAAICHAAGIGREVDLRLGGKTDRFHGDPVPIHGTVVHVSDGKFDLEDTHSHMASMAGTSIRMGPCATIARDTNRILITSKKTAPMDLGQLRSQGIVPEGMAYIGIKAAIAHKAAYDPIAAASYYLETPGLGTNNLRSLPYKKVQRPVYPLDE